MKKKFLRGIAAFLAAVMMLPTAAFAEEPVTEDETAGDPVVVNTDEGGESQELKISDESISLYSGKTKQLSVTGGGTKIIWYSDNDDIASVSSNGLITAKTVAETKTTTIYATSSGETVSCDVTVSPRTFTVEVIAASDYDNKYYVGESPSKTGLTAKVQYIDEDEPNTYTSGFDVLPAKFESAGNHNVKIKYNGQESSNSVQVTVEDVSIASVTIDNTSKKEYNVGDTLDISALVTNNDGTTSKVSGGSLLKIKIDGTEVSSSYQLKESDNGKTLTVSYNGVNAASGITLSVKAKVTKTLTDLTVTAGNNVKTEYYVGESFSSTGYTFTATYSDGSTKNVTTNLTKSPSTFDTAGNSIPVTITYKENGVSKSDTVYVKVVAKSTATEIDNAEDEYELVDEEDIDIEIGDKLNEDIMWYDIFNEVSAKIDGKWVTIDSKKDLEKYPGVELLLKVYGKNDDTIKATHVNSDGEVRLQLYIEGGSTNASKTICVYVPVKAAACTVNIYSSTSYTSSTTPKATATFEDLYDALEALQDDHSDEFEDAFGSKVSLGAKYAIHIKLGDDHSIGKSDVFEPEHHIPVTIDLNGHELTIYAEKWISYDEDDDFKLTITNTNSKNEGTLEYKDKGVTLTVAEGSELEFSEGKIPMDTDAECTVTIYKNGNSTSSSSLLKTKVYDTLKEALESLEELDEALETYNIDEDYEDTFVVRMKLGEDQNLSTFKFAPDYDTTVYIDLNGYTLKLKSEWIDYKDCKALVVKVNNTNKEKKAALTYTDLSNTSLSLASTDSALTFEKDKIPGIYKVEVVPVTNGKVTVNPNKDTVAHGGTVTFTITPNEGYEISSVKDGTKTISAAASGYTVSSKGVGTYKKENITADVKLTVTFKKGTASSSTSSAANWTNPFTDISKSAQYYNAVAFVCSEGLFNGMTATKFEPTTTMTRAMFVTVLGRLAGVDVAKFSGTSFTDVSRSDQQISWAAPYIEWAVQNGITNGTGNGKFSPNDPITHQQMYLFMYRYAMFIENYNTPLTNASLSGIRDADEIADWAVEGIKFASQNSILITTGGKLTPTENALRCELAMLLHGFCTKVLDKNG